MYAIWKYKIDGDNIVLMPRGAQILDMQNQNDNVVIWALVDTANPPEERRFRIFGTGQSMENHPGAYIGTAQSHSGNIVLHVFEISVD